MPPEMHFDPSQLDFDRVVAGRPRSAASIRSASRWSS